MRAQCKVCGSDNTKYIIQHSSNEKSNQHKLYQCNNCDTFFIDAQPQDIIKHLDGRGYTNLQKEESWKEKRIYFFKYLFTIVNKYKKPTKWLDYGCAFGHLIEYLQAEGITSYGVEINNRLCQYCQEKELKVVLKINDLPENQHFDVISAIDSFYYNSNPTLTLKAFHDRLESNGILIMRLTNRNWLMKMYLLLNKKSLEGALGDAFVSYSKKSITMLLESSGFEILNYHYLEQGKKHSVGHQLFYSISNLVSMATLYKWPITPGIIVVARKN